MERLRSQDGQSEDEQAERGRLAGSARQLEEMLNSSDDLRKLKGQISIEFTSQGLRIQVEDLNSQPLFALGSAEPTGSLRELLIAIAHVLQPLPNLVLVEGHTDSKPFPVERTYSNWELSGDRANAARRVLEAGGVDSSRIARVVGYADRKPLHAGGPWERAQSENLDHRLLPRRRSRLKVPVPAESDARSSVTSGGTRDQFRRAAGSGVSPGKGTRPPGPPLSWSSLSPVKIRPWLGEIGGAPPDGSSHRSSFPEIRAHTT